MTHRRLRPVWFGLGISVCILLLASTALADSNARIVRLSYAEGNVRLDRGDGRGFELAVMNMPVAHGNRVWTRNDALAEIEFEDGDTIRLTPETLVILHQLSLRNNGVRVSVVELQEGEAYFRLRDNHDDDFRILLPGRELAVRKSSRLRLAVRGKQVELAVMKGEVEIHGQGERLLVKKGETLTLDPNDADRYYLARSVEEGNYDQWDKDRESYRDRYASSNGYGGYSPHYSYGLSDLHYYGSYFHAPGYGWLWRPYYVSYGWSPFDHGAWVYYPGYGYIWVSAYPWGWTPYRYGGWYYLSGYGWCWQPGRYWNRWASHTPVYRAPRQYRRVERPSRADGTTVRVGRGAQPIFPSSDRGDRGAPGRRRVADFTGDDLSRPTKGARDRGGITPRLPSLGDPDSEVVGKRQSGQPIVFPSRRQPANDDVRALERDYSGGARKGGRESTGASASGSDDRRSTRVLDRNPETSPARRSFVSDADSSGGNQGGSRREVTPRSEPSRSFSAGRSTSPPPAPSRHYSSGSSSPSRSYSSGSSGSSSPSRSYSGSSGASRSSGGNSGGSSRSSSSGSSSRGGTSQR